jgi:DNA anti-recombination protein RmuC
VEMLGSEHLHGLPKEMKRTTVLVALDAAGITLDEVAQDAKARIEAIDSYENDQRKQFETLLARKAEENQQIMAELERIKASYAERMRRNLEGVAREKATFGNWLTVKQTEAQNIREALELCMKNEAGERAVTGGDNGLMGSRINVRT